MCVSFVCDLIVELLRLRTLLPHQTSDRHAEKKRERETRLGIAAVKKKKKEKKRKKRRVGIAVSKSVGLPACLDRGMS